MLTPDDVVSRSDLVSFVDQLSTQAAAWPNNQLNVYLEALAGWIGDLEGWCQNRGAAVPHQPDWRLIAQALAAASAYE